MEVDKLSSKSEVLRILEENKGDSISGEKMAHLIGVSRNAVWKAIKELEKEGYEIEAVTNSGYCLASQNDILSKEGIKPFLKNPELVEQIYVYKTVESTNNTAKHLALTKGEDVMVVISEEQTSGRGRMGRSFFSPAKTGIYMSLILHPKITASKAMLITTAASVAVSRAIETVTCESVQIKWVNDLYLDGKKVCGILTEAVTNFETGNIEHVILGIGINFKTKNDSFPDDIKETAGSILSFDKNITRNRLIAEVINNVLDIMENIESVQYLNEYRKRSFIINENINIITSGLVEEAVAVEIDNNGFLIVKDKNGNMRTLNSGEISIRRV